MIEVSIYKNNKEIIGFSVSGHAGYSEKGTDIVCAGVSVLTINTINSFEEILNFDDFTYAVDNTGIGLIEFELTNNLDDSKGQLLLRSFELGIKSIKEEYMEYIELSYEEVQK